ncbi:hypothetical protein F5884DRAFT_212337 [Xylogone sp. PMI_703]|nr:hypothetical protein F5884DRAFT_212337 [Xylogone sp. PMI_703]
MLSRSSLNRLSSRLSPSTSQFLSSRSVRPLSTSTRYLAPAKDDQDRNSMKVEKSEYTKSSTDDTVAQQTKAAFDPNVTDPESEKVIAGRGNEKDGNPLEVSAANPEVSKQRDEKEGGAQKGTREKASGMGNSKKAGKV